MRRSNELTLNDITEKMGISVQALIGLLKRDRQMLSKREREVLILTAEGLTVKEIACSLNLAVKTVGSHTMAAYKKLGIRGRVQALHWCLLVGWVQVGARLSARAQLSAEKHKKEKELSTLLEDDLP